MVVCNSFLNYLCFQLFFFFDGHGIDFVHFVDDLGFPLANETVVKQMERERRKAGEKKKDKIIKNDFF